MMQVVQRNDSKAITYTTSTVSDSYIPLIYLIQLFLIHIAYSDDASSWQVDSAQTQRFQQQKQLKHGVLEDYLPGNNIFAPENRPYLKETSILTIKGLTGWVLTTIVFQR